MRVATPEDIAVEFDGPWPEAAFERDSLGATLTVVDGEAQVDSAAWVQGWVRRQHRTWGMPADSLAGEVVQMGGARWLRQEYHPAGRGGVGRHVRIYTTAFGRSALMAAFFAADVPSVDTLVPPMVASLEVAPCRTVETVSMLVDSAALARAASVIAPPALPPGVLPVFRVSFDTAGAVVGVESLFDSVPADYAASVVAAIRATARRQVPRPYEEWYLLRVAAGPGAMVDLPSIHLRPAVADQGPYRRVLTEVLQRMEFAPDTRSVGTVKGVLRLRVRADGTIDPASVRIARSTGFAWVDGRLMDGLAKLRFQPATADGIAVAQDISLPVTLARR
jgi:hypothetical protein